MKPLALRASVSPLEMPTSFLSRLAARNLSPDLQTFCQDVGLDLPAILRGEAAGITHLCRLAGIPTDNFDGRVTIKTSTMRYRLGREALNTETLSRGALRFCPCCVSDALHSGAQPWQVIHELHWQFIHIRRCWRHGSVLQSHRSVDDRIAACDFTAFLRDNEQELRQTASPPTTAAADAFDHYLTRRAYGRHGRHWCNRLQTPALCKAAEAFGVLLDHGRDMRASYLDPEQRRDAMLTGFEILTDGRQGIWQALERFNSRTPTRGGNQPHPSNGEVQRLLGSHAKNRKDLDPVRDIVREYFLDHYPFRPGTVVLGHKVTETRVLSLRGACREIGIRRSLLDEILIRRGLAHRDAEGQFHLDTVLTRALVEDISRQKHDYLDQNQTAAMLGCSFAMFKQLQKAGILQPDDGAERWGRKGFHRSALQEFLNSLGMGAERIATEGPDLCTLALATRKAKCSVPKIIRLMLNGKLQARARLSDEIRLDTLLISVNELQSVLRPP